MVVVFAPLAERQLDALYNYIADRSSERVAMRYVSRIVSFCISLAETPAIGTRRDDILSGLRTVGFERRVTIAFFPMRDKLVIEGVFYGGQDFESRLRQ